MGSFVPAPSSQTLIRLSYCALLIPKQFGALSKEEPGFVDPLDVQPHVLVL